MEIETLVADRQRKMLALSAGYPDSFPWYSKIKDAIFPGGAYNGVTLLEGWLIEKQSNKKEKEAEITEIMGKLYIWSLRDDIKINQINFVCDLMHAVEERVQSVTHNHYLSVLEIFDAGALVSLHCATE